jgi:Tfp pilus assembly protein PilN
MISYYADRVAATIPDSVTLTNLNIYPALSKFSLGVKQWSFQQDTILLTGYCNDPTLLDTWIDQIKTIKNIKQSKINSYLNKKQGTAGIFTAEVLIK